MPYPHPDCNCNTHPTSQCRCCGGGIPGDYVEPVDGTIPDTPYTREMLDSIPTMTMEEWHEQEERRTAGETSTMSMGDALMRLRLACKSLRDMCRVVSGEHGVAMDVVFLAPYCSSETLGAIVDGGLDVSDVTDLVFTVGGKAASSASYDDLCELWSKGPEEMHAWLEDLLEIDRSIDTVLSAVHDMVVADEEDGEEEPLHGSVFAIVTGSGDEDDSDGHCECQLL